MRQPRVQPGGFTLLELVIVMLVICIAMAVVVPMFHGFSDSSRLNDAAIQIVALGRFARTQAVSEGRTYRLNLDVQGGTYWLSMQGQTGFVDLGTDMGVHFSVPEGMQMSLTRSDQSSGNTIDFFPSGRTEMVRIHLKDSVGRQVEVGCQSPAELFEVIGQPEERT